MEAVCGAGAEGEGAEPGCATHALTAALHALHLYCATLAAAALCCTRCSPVRPRWKGSRWRGQNVRGTASLLLGVTWCCGLAAAALRADGVRLAHALAALLAWLAACALHLLLWWRRAAAPLLYLAIYWLLASAAAAAVLWHHIHAGASYTHVQLYVQGFTIVLAFVISIVDWVCFYDEVTKRNHGPQESFTKDNVTYKHNETHFFSKITFFWLNPLLYKGYCETTHDEDDFGELPDDEKSSTIYARFKRIYQKYKQSMVYDKCMRLASWSSTDSEIDEESPLLQSIEETAPSQSGLITNLISQDTYNVMSCVWVCHYIWAIPLKVAVILYLLYTKLGVSAILGTAVSIIIITPLQFYIGKRLSDNSKDISKCTDHRVSKMSEILQGINVIKLYVWEDLFNEKILQLREVELRKLNKDSVYWGILTFTTQASTILITVVTYTLLYFLDNGKGLTVVNVLAGLALFNQLAIPLLILPVTVLMVIQAMVSTNRIKDFLDLPESSNVKEDNYGQDACDIKENDVLVNNAATSVPNCNMYTEQDDANKDIDMECEDQFFEDNKPTCNDQEYLIRLKNAAFSWKMRDNSWLDVDDLDIPVGKLIMVVGSTGSGKTSLLSAVLGEMHLERGEISWNGEYSASYAGQPPWLLEGSIRENILLGRRWNPAEYSRALRAAALRPDLQLLPDGDRTQLGRGGAPLSGGQRVRVCVARTVYSGARLLALDEPLAALDAALARHVVARGLLPAARAGTTVLLATNRLELLHYADLVIAMEEGRVRDVGRPGSGGGPCGTAGEGTLRRWARRAAEARAAVARTGAGPPGGSARERARLQRALSRNNFNRHDADEDTVGICEATGAHLLAEVPTRAGGSWRRGARPRSSLSRQLSSPPPSMHLYKWRREVRRAVSAEEGAGERVRVHRTLARWTPRTLHRLLSTDSDTQPEEQSDDKEQSTTKDTTFVSITSNGIETSINNSDKLITDKEDPEQVISESSVWCAYARACGWWGGVYWAAAAGAQALALAADYWLSTRAAQNSQEPLENDELWRSVYVYVCWCVCGAGAAGAAQLGAACGGAAARRALHERLLRAVLHAPPHHAHQAALHRFSADIAVVDRKLSTAVTRWAQLALACAAAALLNVAASAWTLLACLPAFLCFLLLQNVYLRNTRELQRSEARSAARVVSLSAQASAGAGTVRAGRLQAAMRAALRARLDTNHAALLLLNAANRWLGLSLVSPIPSGWQRNGKIEFENVTVQHHPDAPPILKNINLTVNPGEKLAICGRSGSGKSTLVLTCAGATPVLDGRVLVDGAEAGAVPLRALRHRVLVLPQEGALFSGTLRENLDPLAVHTDDEIWQCLKAVGLYEFVTAQSAGLECPVGGARGARWAGGRGARACAARAALHARFAAALLLDEPGAALDATAERDLLAALAAAAPNTTLITVAHRMSSVRGYDRAAVMEEGRIVELGSMRSLLSQPSSRLARMFATNQTH
ncbi:Canalicular multispecific organic anion transporter 2 [Papilio machaon]|uniref:Canalicular multispecific organic anion transporter 2 n=1 Tax=Papilio machaon TaxID=76193 RepID=A0A194RCN0_PAPMA|nr:Canalicular multispecific organic anion transporter 2 [Papilio machaon]